METRGARDDPALVSKAWCILGLGVAALAATGCAESHVRDPHTEGGGTDAGIPTVLGPACVPTVVPEGGFSSAEVTVETYTPVCGEPPLEGIPTRPPIGVCVVYALEGDPRPGCTRDCSSPVEAARRAFCTCRCDGDPGTGPFCACPADARCERLVEFGGRSGGGFCVPDSLPSR